MPVYEYLCRGCNRIYQFLVKDISKTPEGPPCPRCAAPTERVLSRFSIGSRPPGDSTDVDDADMAALSGEDPRAMASAIRRMADDMGEELEPELREALSRLEAGEDPESIERDLENGGAGSPPPSRDGGLYDPPG